ncbi:MAG: CPBP family glutamic-type intramembrane protease, partial [Planctomycetota bacterium]
MGGLVAAAVPVVTETTPPTPVDQGDALLIALSVTGAITLSILVIALATGLLRWRGVLTGTVQPVAREAPCRWGLFGVAFGLYVLGNIAAVIVVAWMKGGVDAMQSALAEDPRILLAMSVGPWLVVIPLTALAGRFFPFDAWRKLGWRWVGLLHGLVAAPMIIPVVLFVGVVTQVVRYQIGASLDESHPLLAGLETDPLLLIAMVLGVGVIVPFAEEVAFRGLLQSAIGTSLARVADPMAEAAARWVGIFITSAIFMVI